MLPPPDRGASPRVGPPRSHVPGRMTAAMRALQPASGPRVLRIGLVTGGRIIEERIVKQRTSVTLGPRESSTFVVRADLPLAFKLFERIGPDYYLNILGTMTGRIALETGTVDLSVLQAAARRVGLACRVRLSEGARGKIVVGEATFLFQFVALPHVQARPQLPLSVKGGMASQIDWRLTIIAALSFLVHFGFVGGMYSDWMDPVLDEDLTAGLVDMIQKTAPQAVETAAATNQEFPTDAKPPTHETPKSAAVGPPKRSSAPTDAAATQSLIKEADEMTVAILGGLGAGPSIRAVMAEPAGAPVDLNTLGNRPDGIGNTRGLHLPGDSGPLTRKRDWAILPSSQTYVPEVATATKVTPFIVDHTPPSMTAPVANAEAVIVAQIQPGARRCYQRGLDADPTQSGKLSLLIKIAPSGEVDGVTVTGNTGLSAQVVSCIQLVVRRARFDAPGANGSSLSVPLSFLRQGR
jgi:hypothetical protein